MATRLNSKMFNISARKACIELVEMNKGSRRYKFVFLLLIVLLIPFQPAQAQGISGTMYIVQSGDTLSSIATSFNVDVAALMSANGITDPNQIDVGQQLIIPGIVIVNIGDSYRGLLRQIGRAHV